MGLMAGITVYTCLWWVLWFMILPWRVAPQSNPVPGSERGAPEQPRIKQKVLICTALAAVFWVIIDQVIRAEMYSFDTSSDFTQSIVSNPVQK